MNSQEFRTRIRVALRAEATATTNAEREYAVRELCVLHESLVTHPQLRERFQRQWSAKIRSRLRTVQRKMERRIDRGEGTQKTSPLSGENLGRGGNAVAEDHGDELVELIQRTISPDIWDVNGGEASIYYYRPLHALVITAPGGVHRQTGNALNRIRAAGP